MQCLSVMQPWVHHIFFDGKDVENRTWKTDFRWDLLIHAGKRFDGSIDTPEERAMERGAIVGVVSLVDVVRNAHSTWAEPGQFHWILMHPRPFRAPLKNYRGQLKLFDVEPYQIARQLEETFATHWKEATIRSRKVDGRSIESYGHVLAHFGVDCRHYEDGTRHTVIHLPSGKALASMTEDAQARRFVEATIALPVAWELPEPSLSPDIRQTIFELRKKCA